MKNLRISPYVIYFYKFIYIKQTLSQTILQFLSIHGLFVDTRILKNLARQGKFEGLELDIENLNGLIKFLDNKKRQKGRYGYVINHKTILCQNYVNVLN